MLRKLLKYELRATARTFLPLYIALLFFSVFNKFFTTFEVDGFGPKLPAVIGIMVYSSILVAVGVMTVVVMIQRFQKNLLGDEGYLMFTLPVDTWKLIASKFLTTLIWLVASTLVTGSTIFIMVINAETWGAMVEFFSMLPIFLRQHFGYGDDLFLFELFLSFFVSVMNAIMMVYASIALGHLFNRYRSLASFGAFIALSTIEQTFLTFIMRVFFGWDNLFAESVFFLQSVSGRYTMLLVQVLFSLVFLTCYFLISNHILSHRLNLD